MVMGLAAGLGRCRLQIVQTQLSILRYIICAKPDVDMPTRLAVSANEMPYSLISFSVIILLSFGKGRRRLPPWRMVGVSFSLAQRVCCANTS